jgi:N-acyl-D-aspartate/D-glutamate deacylase
VTADQYPYDASSTSITAMLLPDEEREGGDNGLKKNLADPVEVERLRKIIKDSLEVRGRIMVARCPQHPEWVGKLISEIAAAESRDDVEVALDIIRTSDEAGVSFSMDEADVRYVMTLPWVATASDGGVKIDDGTRPHPRSFGTFPRKIGRYALQEKVIPLEQAIRSATGLAADIIGMNDRGYLRENYFADVVVIDTQNFLDHATFENPFEPSTGVRYLVINGKLAIDDGNLAITDAGRPLRKSTAHVNP